jgi:hypothetical protein
MASKKDYVAVAHLLHEELRYHTSVVRDAYVQATLRRLTKGFADLFEKDSPNFDRDKFMAAADV